MTPGVLHLCTASAMISHMFIRASTQKDRKTKQHYTTYRLVRGYRNADGKVRQETLINLGSHFSVPKKHWKALSDRIKELLSSQHHLFPIESSLEKEAQAITKKVAHRYAKIQERESKQSAVPVSQPDYQSVDINSLQYQHVRHIGVEHVCHETALQLQLDTILQSLRWNQRKIHLAFASIIGRIVHPGSELRTHRYLKDQSALDELMGTDFSNLSLKNFYKIADELFKNKATIEKSLYAREKDLFHLNDIVTLYDITNTYFEGRALGNEKARYGRSKEKRSDCPLVSMGLVLDVSGFPKKSEIFPGNVSEPKTMANMLRALGAHPSATIVMDAGFATEANIQWLKDNKYHYVVVSRKKCIPPDADAESVLVKDSPNNKVSATLVKNNDSNELELYCHSEAKEKKSSVMVSKSEIRFEEELKKLTDGLKKKTGVKKYDKINQRVGRLKEKYKSVAKYYSINVEADEKSEKVVGIHWKKGKPDKKLLGIYCLRTNKMDVEANDFWKIYTMLTEVEAAFRCLKTDLGFRPVFHQKESRVDAHLFISVLAYHLLCAIRHQLKKQNIYASWQTIQELLSTQMRITSTLNIENGGKLSIRKTTTPTPEQMAIYKALGVDAIPGKTEKANF